MAMFLGTARDHDVQRHHDREADQERQDVLRRNDIRSSAVSGARR